MEIQKAFSFWLDRTSRMMKYFASTKANELNLGITIDQWVILLIISQGDNISQTDIVERTFKDKASVARISDILDKKGYIERKRNPENRREYMMKSTKRGILKVEELTPYVMEAREIGMKGFSEEELVSLVSMLQRIHNNYQKALEDDSNTK